MKNIIFESEIGYIPALELRTILKRAFDNAKTLYDRAMADNQLPLATIYKSEMDSITKFEIDALQREMERIEKAKKIIIHDIPKTDDTKDGDVPF